MPEISSYLQQCSYWVSSQADPIIGTFLLVKCSKFLIINPSMLRRMIKTEVDLAHLHDIERGGGQVAGDPVWRVALAMQHHLACVVGGEEVPHPSPLPPRTIPLAVGASVWPVSGRPRLPSCGIFVSNVAVFNSTHLFCARFTHNPAPRKND